MSSNLQNEYGVTRRSLRSKRILTAQLSCEQCRTRKIKCDKRDPCSNCISSGAACVAVHRARLPRGRHKRRTPEVPVLASPDERASHSTVTGNVTSLDDRVCRLERLMREPGSLSDSSSSKDPTATIVNLGQADRGVAWSRLSQEIQDLRRMIGRLGESKGSSCNVRMNRPSTDSRSAATDGGMRLLGFSSSDDSMSSVTNAGLSKQLCEVFLHQVDPIIKVLHRPSLRRWMLNNEEYLGYPPGHSSVEALRAAVCYSAAFSLTEDRCQSTLSTSKASLVHASKQACEAALESADLLSTRDITTLQAFVIYLSTRRAAERSRAVWTLVSVAVRLAKSLCFPADYNSGVGEQTFFQHEMRKRLWYAVCVLDMQMSFGQRSLPLTEKDDKATLISLPFNIDDAAFDTTTMEPVLEKQGLTDMTLALITYSALPHGRATVSAMCQGHGGRARHASTGNITGEYYLALLQTFGQRVSSLLESCDPDSSPYAWFTYHNAHLLLSTSRLSALRPFQRTPHTLPRTDSAELLRLTLTVLDEARLLQTDPRGEGFLWCVNVPWHALAIAFAECYICTDADLLRRTWPLVETAYAWHREKIGAPSVQAPLTKLMSRARERVETLLQDDGNNVSVEGSAAFTSETPMALQPWTWTGTAFATGPTDVTADGRLVADTGLLSGDGMDAAWGVWNDFMSGISFDGFEHNAAFEYDV